MPWADLNACGSSTTGGLPRHSCTPDLIRALQVTPRHPCTPRHPLQLCPGPGAALSSLPVAPRTRMRWPDDSAPDTGRAARPEPSWACCACGCRGRWHRCGRCRTVHYCSIECQAAHWPAHRLHCRILPADTAGGGPSTDGPALPGVDPRADGPGTPCTWHELLGATGAGPPTANPTTTDTPGPSLDEVELADLPRPAGATPQQEALHAAEVEGEAHEYPCEEAGFATIPPWEYAQSPHGEDEEGTPRRDLSQDTGERWMPAIPRGWLPHTVAEPHGTPSDGCHVDLPGGSL